MTTNNDMPNVHFKPWVGDNYSRGFQGKRVLVFGESHYDGADQDLTIKCVRAQTDGSWSKRFWTNIAIAFLDKNPQLDDKSAFWHSVVFANLVQENVGSREDRPTDEMWKTVAPAFQDMVNKYRPNFIAVFGLKVWEHLPEFDKDSDHPNTGLGFYSHPDGMALAFVIKHPSRAFNGRDWHESLMQALAAAPSD